MLKVIKEDNTEAVASMYDYDKDLDTKFDKDVEDDIDMSPASDDAIKDTTVSTDDDEIDDSDIVSVQDTDISDDTDEDDQEILTETSADDLRLLAKDLITSTDKAHIRTNLQYLKVLDKGLYRDAMKLLKAGRSLTYVAKVVSDTILNKNESCDEATNPGSIGHFKKSTIGDKKEVCPECGLEDCICDECDSIVNESNDMTGSDEYAAERAIYYYKHNEISIEDAVSRACNEVSDGNSEPDYEDEDFYQEEADYNTVLNYVKSKLGLTEEDIVDECDIVEEDIDDFDLDEEDTTSEWEFVESKSVTDSDGCSTDYTLYHNPSTGQYICMFGDIELYDPDPMYADFETDSEDEAREWFDSYNGIIDDEDLYFENKKVEESHDKWLAKAKKSGHSFMNLVESYQKSTGITVPKKSETREDQVVIRHFKKWCESNMF